MKKYILGFALLISATQMLQAQDAETVKVNKFKFIAYQNFGLQYDGQSVSLQGDVSAGIKKGKMAYMLGAGITGKPSLNVNTYADVRYFIGKKQRFFSLANVGVSNWLNNNWNTYPEGDIYYSITNPDRKNKVGLHLASGIGASAQIGKELKYNVALVYSYTALQYETFYYLPTQQQETLTVNYNRLQWGLRLGLSF